MAAPGRGLRLALISLLTCHSSTWRAVPIDAWAVSGHTAAAEAPTTQLTGTRHTHNWTLHYTAVDCRAALETGAMMFAASVSEHQPHYWPQATAAWASCLLQRPAHGPVEPNHFNTSESPPPTVGARSLADTTVLQVVACISYERPHAPASVQPGSHSSSAERGAAGPRLAGCPTQP
jgi:hypothetical protein